MSHNYPYRRPPSDIDLRPEAGPYCSADRRHTSPDHDFYRPPQESFSSSYPSSSSSRGLTSAQCSQDGALSILSSCGLEPSDLALLAELPEDVLTVESLPYVLAQLKGKRGTIRSFSTNTLSASSSSSSSSYHRPPVSSSTSDWDQLRSQPVQYPVDQVTCSSLLSEQDCWGNPRTSGSVRAHPIPSSTSSSSKSRYVVDFKHRPRPPEYGKIVRATAQVSSQELPSFSLGGQGKRTHLAQFSEPRSADYRTAPPPDEHCPKPWGEHRESQTSSIRSSSRQTAAALMPSEKKALDFHGTCPTVFPYSCSLCDITVLSEKVWNKHINGTQHAEGQLSLLQQFPNWDCRLESVNRANNQSEKQKDEEKPSRPSQTANQNHKPQPNIKPEKKVSEKSKVVCVRFPPQSVDEAYLRKLTEPFGKIVKILMFPSLAFVELGSIDQAKDLVKFHVNYPPTVNGEKIEFRISSTFNFLQSSQVVSFIPVPKGEDGKSDLISIVKRFGPPLYTLFLPSTAFVEMKNASDAQKLIDYYSANTLRINNDHIKVAFSGEYKTLMRVPSAKRYEEESVSTKRARSSSGESENSKRRRSSGSKDQEQESRKSSRERRSRSRETSSREKTTNTRSKSRDKCRDESNKERKTRSRSRDKFREKSSRRTRSRSKSKEESSRERKTRSRDKSSSRSSRQNSPREKSVEAKTPETSRTKGEPTPLGEAAEKPQTEEKAALSAGESDIEGMEVIGEDGENVEEEDMDFQDDTDGEEEEEVEENDSQAEKGDSPEEDVCEMKKQEEESETKGETKVATESPLEDDEQEQDFPVDLEHCITLDELGEDQSDDGGEDNRDETRAPSTRVIYFKDLPLSFYTDVEFIKLVKDFGKAARYLLIRRRQEGFIEMSSSSEAQKAAKELSCKSVTFKGSKVNVRISHRYFRLSNGWEVPSDSDKEKRSQSQSSSRKRSERRSKSKTSDRDEICAKSEGKESSKKTPEKESGSKTSTKKMPDKESPNNKTQEKDFKNSSKKESNTRKTPEEESDKKTPRAKPHWESSNKKPSKEECVSKNDPEKELLNKKPEEVNARQTPEKELVPKNLSEKASRRTPDKELSSENTSDEEPLSEKTDEKNSVAKTTKGKKGPEKEPLPGMSQENKNLKTTENELVPEKTLKTESDSEKSQKEKENSETGEKGSAEETPETEEGGKMSSKCQGACLKEETSESAESPDQQDSTKDLPEQWVKQEADNKEQLQGSVPAWDAADPEKSAKPVGMEFVRPVVGYFCNLCQLIYADEDEAKLQHCSSLMHYRKYQEKTGKDPWSSWDK